MLKLENPALKDSLKIMIAFYFQETKKIKRRGLQR